MKNKLTLKKDSLKDAFKSNLKESCYINYNFALKLFLVLFNIII